MENASCTYLREHRHAYIYVRNIKNYFYFGKWYNTIRNYFSEFWLIENSIISQDIKWSFGLFVVFCGPMSGKLRDQGLRLATMNMSYNIVIRDNQVYVIKIKSIFISTSGFGNTICKYFSEKCVNLKCKYSRVFTFWGKGEGGGLKPPRASSLLQLNTLQMIVVYAYPLFLWYLAYINGERKIPEEINMISRFESKCELAASTKPMGFVLNTTNLFSDKFPELTFLFIILFIILYLYIQCLEY